MAMLPLPALSTLLARAFTSFQKQFSSYVNHSIVCPVKMYAAFIKHLLQARPDVNKAIRTDTAPLFLALRVWRRRWGLNNNYYCDHC